MVVLCSDRKNELLQKEILLTAIYFLAEQSQRQPLQDIKS